MTHCKSCLLVCLMFAPSAHAQTSWPMLNSATPCAIQIGTKTEVIFTAVHGGIGAYHAVVGGQGVTGEIVGAVPSSVLSSSAPAARAEGKIKVVFTVAADASVGIRDVRLLTPNGPSSLGQLIVVRDPIVREANPNGSMKQAQPVALPATLCGAIESKEDVDFYKFKVEAGTALTFHVVSQRLLNKLTSVTTYSAPIITLRNSAGSVLASNDYFFGGDPLLHHRFTAAGEYYLEIRDVRYDGNRFWEYAIEIHDRPFVASISPACLPQGVPTRVKLIGFNLPADPFVTVTLPAEAPAWDHWLPLPSVAGKPVNAVLVRPSSLPVVQSKQAELRKEPGKKPEDRTQALALPCAVVGVIERPDDVDRYTFQARKGERFTFQIAARPLNSALDSVMRIVNQKGEILIENDDASDKTGRRENRNEILSADSRIESWEAPANGSYVIEVTDVHGRGGERFTYSLLARSSQPHFLLEIPGDRTVLAPGSGGVIFVRSIRKEGFTGDIQLKVEGLPPGVTAVCGSIPGPCQDGCILLRADRAKIRSFGTVRVIGTATIPGPDKTSATQTAVARPFGELLRDGGARYMVPVDSHVVTVLDAVDVKAVRFRPAEITLRPGESQKVEVTIERRPGFQEAVSLTVMSHLLGSVFGNCLPEGVTIDPASQVRLTGGQLTGTIVFKAAADAKPVNRQLVPILGEVSVNFTLRMLHAGGPFWLTVEGKR